MSFNVARVRQNVVGEPEDETHECDDPDLQPVLRRARIPFQWNAHLKIYFICSRTVQ